MVQTTVSIPTRTLVTGMVHDDGAIVSDEVYAVAEACGQSDDQVRSCLRRLVTEGLIERRSGSGRTAVYDATPSGLASVGATIERTRLAYVQDAAGRGWDRHWHLVAFAVPERNRRSRDGFRDRLLALGGAPVQGGLYVSPHQWHKDVRVAAEQFDILDAVTLASTDDLAVGDERDPRGIAQRLWPLGEIADRYSTFVERYEWMLPALEDMRVRRERLPDASFLPGALAMGVEFAEVFNADPLLPPELLPRPWPGRAARELVLRCRRLALKLRQGPGRPALFHNFDEAIGAIP
ncbi:MAG TPA: PaaX family transcriptional regulator C-terminal domain-containing protein [Acidimicrobiales bacterium]|nr:PaaX family transcriptional regulator C-terminal domain-containing protein [Acidimicrobiales bacterium]